MRKIKAVFSLTLMGLVLVFAIQNSANRDIQFLIWSFSMPFVLLIALLLGTGILIGLTICSISTLRGK